METKINIRQALQEIKQNVREIEIRIDILESDHTDWLDTADVGRLYKIAERSLNRHRAQNVIPYSHIGGKIFFNRADIENILKANYGFKKDKR